MTVAGPALLLMLAAASAVAMGAAVLVRGGRSRTASDRLDELLALARSEDQSYSRWRQINPRWLPTRLRVRLDQSDIAMAAGHLMALPAAVVATAITIGLLVEIWVGAAVLLACVIGSLSYVEWRAARRMDALFLALPGFLDNVRQLVTIGNSVQQAFEKAIQMAPYPVARPMRITLHQLRHGVPLTDCLTNLADRLQIVELHMLASAVQANLRFGGRISDVLANLVRVYRDRQRVERELKAATSETRTSALVLAIIPAALIALLAAINPDYFKFFLETEDGRKMLAFCVGMQGMGILMMRRMARVRY